MSVVRRREDGKAVQHPILDNVRRCSLTPDEAVDFFTLMLHPHSYMRPTATQALEHPYIRRCAGQMRDYLRSQASVVQEPTQDSPEPPASDRAVRQKPGKLLGRVGGALKKQGGRLARTAAHVLKPLSLLKRRRTAASSTDPANMTDAVSSSASNSEPPLSAYFFEYQHQAERRSPKQAQQVASVGTPSSLTLSEVSRQQQSLSHLSNSGQRRSRAASMLQQAGTDQQAKSIVSVASQMPPRQALVPLGQVQQTGHSRQAISAQKELAGSALPAVPASSIPHQPEFKQPPTQSEADKGPGEPVHILEPSASRYRPFVC